MPVEREIFSLRPDLHNFTNMGVRSGRSIPCGIRAQGGEGGGMSYLKF